MAAIRGWTIVTTDEVDSYFSKKKDDFVRIKKPYTIDLPLWRADTQTSDAQWRVFHQKDQAERYIKQFLKSDDYRVVPVVLSACKRRKADVPSRSDD